MTRPPPPRVLGELGPVGSGPSLLVVSGMHGNEPAGIQASLRVLERLQGRAEGLTGRVLFLTGNRSALATGVRYLDRDLNRAWRPDRLRRLPPPGPDFPSSPAEEEEEGEDREQRELFGHLERFLAQARGPRFAVDLHTTSASRGVFTTVGDTLENRALARSLPVPLVLGLEEMVEGTLHEYLASRGVVSLVFESGEHREAAAVDRAEAGLWILLATTGLLPGRAIPELGAARELLARSGAELPRVVELLHRHPVTPGDGFRMRDGLANFTPVAGGEVLAEDRSGPVAAPAAGRLLMPLYQAQGEDGFFLVREVRVLWLGVSRVLREAGAHRAAHLLPGVRKDPSNPDALLVDTRVARWYPLQLLHLLGYRRQRQDGPTLVVLRQAAWTGAIGAPEHPEIP